MTHRLVPFRWMALRRSAALSAALALFIPSLASAQTPAPPASPPAASATLLSPARFARLVQDRPVEAATPNPVPASKASPPQPPRRSGAGFVRKTLVVLGVVGILVGLLAVSYYTGIDTEDLLSGFVGSRR
jgi:hypothetical protein